MASSSDTGVRGFVPPQNEAERFLMHRVQELCELAHRRGIPRSTGFLSDREQILASAAMNREDCTYGRFWGGWSQAERKVLCLEPPDTWQLEPVAALRLTALHAQPPRVPGHREYLGAILGLGLDRACLGDILSDPEDPCVMYAFVLEDKLDFLAQELHQAGSFSVRAEPCETVPGRVLAEPDRELHDTTVSSLRADAVLAAMMHTSRTLAAQAISGGKVEINHLPLHSAAEPVYAGDLFTVRGAGRWRVKEIGGTSRKGRLFITYFQY